MDSLAREKLRSIVAVALALVPLRLRRAYAEKPTGVSDPAKKAIAEQIADGICQSFDVTEKSPPVAGPSLHSGLMAAMKDKARE
jgi:hypothetical protein